MAPAAFIASLKSAVGVASAAPLVLLGNFEVEHHWGRGEAGLPRLGFETTNAIVNRMDELALLLGGPDDVVVLKGTPDQGYLAALAALGLALPRILVVGDSRPGDTVTQDALRDDTLQSRLRELATVGAALLPHGISQDEERLAATTGLALAGPSWHVCKRVNSKIYSRRLAQRLGLRQPAGYACDSMQAWQEAVAWARELLRSGRRVAVKDAYGVSGKGIAVVSDDRRLDQLDRIIGSQVRSAGGRAALVVEEWVAKAADLNYQLTVGRDGGVDFNFVKEAVTDQGVHKGHRTPSPVTGRQHAELTDAASRLGAALAADGYYGVAGVDAMLDPDGGLYPVVEINARNNMSTYQARLDDEIVGAGRAALARHYPLSLRRPLSFARLREALDGLLVDRPGGVGIVVHGFATVNAAFTLAPGAREPETAKSPSVPAGPVHGRLYALLAAPDAAAVGSLDAEAARRLAALE